MQDFLLFKVCARCKQTKSVNEFPCQREGFLGRHSYCKPCYGIKSAIYREKARKLGKIRNAYLRDKKKKAIYEFQRKYGITIADYEALFALQEGKCAICLQPESMVDTRYGTLRRLCVDHDHETKQVRGLLCHHCNVAIGLFKHSVSNCQKAIEYLGRDLPRVVSSTTVSSSATSAPRLLRMTRNMTRPAPSTSTPSLPSKLKR